MTRSYTIARQHDGNHPNKIRPGRRQAGSAMERRILITGALGQIGSELVPALRERYGAERIVASDLRIVPLQLAGGAAYEHLDCTEPQQIFEVIRRHAIGTIYHLAALLSAVAEERPHAAWSINMGGLYNVLEAARQYRCQVFFPSSIGVFGP